MYIPSNLDEFPYNSNIISKCNSSIDKLIPIFLYGPNGSGKKSFSKLLLNNFDIFYINSTDLISSKSINSILDNIISQKESLRFIKTVQNLKKLKKGQLTKLNIEVSNKYLNKNSKIGIF